MIELPEAKTIARDLRNHIIGKKIINVGGNFTDHKFTFYYGDPNKYRSYLKNKRVTDIIDRNYYVEVVIEDYTLVFRDGANIRLYSSLKNVPAKSKLLLELEDGTCLNVTTSMYSFICVFKTNEGMNDKYYQLELDRKGVLDKDFTFSYFESLIDENTKKLSLKAFLATEQRILGIGNGIVQDILFQARMHPKRKVNTLSSDDVKKLYKALLNTVQEMVKQGGRDTEKNIFGKAGEYQTILSSKTYQKGCPICAGEIKKENFLGGSIYYCPHCQKND